MKLKRVIAPALAAMMGAGAVALVKWSNSS
jgi:hypothetical protein